MKNLLNVQNMKYLLLMIFIMSLIIFLVKFRTKFKSSVITMITKARYGKISKEALGNIINKIQKSDLDDRMVLVMAEIIHTIPFINMLYILIPKPVFVKFLNSAVQNIFNSIEVSLKGDTLYGDTTIKEKVAVETVSTLAISHIDNLLPRIEEQDKKINKILTLVENISTVQNNPVVEDIKDKIETVTTVKEKLNMGKKLIFGNTEVEGDNNE